METSNSTCSKSVADTLLDAALYIDSHGWCQGNLFEEVPGALPRACMLGAIKLVTDDSIAHEATCTSVAEAALDAALLNRQSNPSVQYAVSYLADFLDDGIYRDDETPAEVVWKFNDHPDTTQQLITYALRTAAKRARVELADQLVAS